MEKKVVAVNRKAKHEYHIIEDFEAGIILTGTEVKSLRSGRASIQDSFGKTRQDALYLVNMNIPEYAQGNIFNHEPLRQRKLLLHKREIQRISGLMSQKGLTIIPLELYFSSKGYAKVKIAIAKGKQLFDKRESIKKEEQKREIAKALRARNR